MRDNKQVVELLEQVRDAIITQGQVSVTQSDLIAQVDRIIDQSNRLRIYRILTAVLTGISLVLGILQYNNTREQPTDIEKQPQGIIKPKPTGGQTEVPSLSNLENEPSTDKRFKLLEANLDSIPSSLSLNQLGNYIQLFQPESYKLRVVRLLQPRIKSNYSDNELEAFKKLFNEYKQSEVEALLPKREK